MLILQNKQITLGTHTKHHIYMQLPAHKHHQIGAKLYIIYICYNHKYNNNERKYTVDTHFIVTNQWENL